MKFANVRFDDPDDLSRNSSIFIHLYMQLQVLDYARRVFERKRDASSIKRAEEIRKMYKKTIYDCTYLIRSIIPEDVMHDQSRMFRTLIEEQQRAEKLNRSKK